MSNAISGNGGGDERTDDDGDGNGGPIAVKNRVQQHRARLKATQRRRLEVCISIPLIDMVGQIAERRKEPMSSTVQDALQYYVKEHQWLAAETQRLDEVRGRLPANVNSVADRHQLEEYSGMLNVCYKRQGMCLENYPSSQIEEPVPSPRFLISGGVVSYLTEELVRQGHDVKLFTSGDSARPLNFAQLLRKRFVNQPVSFARGSTRHFGPRV